MKKLQTKVVSLIIVFIFTLSNMQAFALFLPYNWDTYPGGPKLDISTVGSYGGATTIYTQEIPVEITYESGSIKAANSNNPTIILTALGGLDSYTSDPRNLGLAPYAFAWSETNTPPPLTADWFLAGATVDGNNVTSATLDVNEAISKIVGATDLNKDGPQDTAEETAIKAHAESLRLEFGKTYYFFVFRYGGKNLFDSSATNEDGRTPEIGFLPSYYTNNAGTPRNDFDLIEGMRVPMPAAPAKHTISYDLQGGASSDDLITRSELVINGNKATQPSNPTKSGSTFAGWYTSEDFTTKFDFSSTITSSMTLYAKWTTAGGGSSGNTQKPDEDPVFSDVKKSDWFYDDVMWASKNKITNGVSATEFAPNSAVTRAQFAQFLFNFEAPQGECDATRFVDVPLGIWYSDAIAWANWNGIVYGVDLTHFAPDEYITREQMCVMISRYKEYKKLSFTITSQHISFIDENEISDYAKEAIQNLYKLGLITGMDNSTINPKGLCTRAQVVTILHRLSNLMK